MVPRRIEIKAGAEAVSEINKIFKLCEVIK